MRRAGITQLAECQLPKLNVAGSIPVARSILLLAILLPVCATAQTGFQQNDFWLKASGSGLGSSQTDYELDHWDLTVQLNSGNRKALVPLIGILVAEGRIHEAEIWMEGRGRVVPVTRRDLGIALAWYGRYDLYGILGEDLEIPPDLREDDYGPTLAAIITMGWMRTSQDGFFHPRLLVGRADLQLIADAFFPASFSWEREWIGMASLDSLFRHGGWERAPR